MLKTPGESPIVKTATTAMMNEQQQQQQRSVCAVTTSSTCDKQQQQQQQQHHQFRRTKEANGSTTVRLAASATPLHTADIGVSIRLMQCLEASSYQSNSNSNDNNKKQTNPLLLKKVQDVESRFRGSLRTTTRETREEDWKKRVESVKKNHDAKMAEVHRKTQTHRLFKHIAFEQRMAALSSAAAAPAGQYTESQRLEERDNNKITLSKDSAANLFPTTANTLTRGQVEEYFAVPSFLRQLVSSLATTELQERR